MVLSKNMITNVTTIIEMLEVNGNSSVYQQKKQLLDEEGLHLLTKVRRKLYRNKQHKDIVNISDDEDITTQYKNICNTSTNYYLPIIKELLTIFNTTNDDEKYSEFSTYLNTIVEADKAAAFLKSHGDAMTTADIAPFICKVNAGIDATSEVDKFFTITKDELTKKYCKIPK